MTWRSEIGGDMFRLPDLAEVVGAAEQLGIKMSADEAMIYRTAIGKQLQTFMDFYEAEVQEDKLSRPTGCREPGHRPKSHDNPYNAWIWRCHIEGAADGPLKGKTVGLKDHIPVAALPLTYGSY